MKRVFFGDGYWLAASYVSVSYEDLFSNHLLSVSISIYISILSRFISVLEREGNCAWETKSEKVRILWLLCYAPQILRSSVVFDKSIQIDTISINFNNTISIDIDLLLPYWIFLLIIIDIVLKNFWLLKTANMWHNFRNLYRKPHCRGMSPKSFNKNNNIVWRWLPITTNFKHKAR